MLQLVANFLEAEALKVDLNCDLEGELLLMDEILHHLGALNYCNS